MLVVACSSGRGEVIDVGSLPDRWDSGWESARALRRAARKSASRCRGDVFLFAHVNESFRMGCRRRLVRGLMPAVWAIEDE